MGGKEKEKKNTLQRHGGVHIYDSDIPDTVPPRRVVPRRKRPTSAGNPGGQDGRCVTDAVSNAAARRRSACSGEKHFPPQLSGPAVITFHPRVA